MVLYAAAAGGAGASKGQRTSAKRKIVLKWTGAPAQESKTSDKSVVVG